LGDCAADSLWSERLGLCSTEATQEMRLPSWLMPPTSREQRLDFDGDRAPSRFSRCHFALQFPIRASD
jgi:hypothetical protein